MTNVLVLGTMILYLNVRRVDVKKKIKNHVDTLSVVDAVRLHLFLLAYIMFRTKYSKKNNQILTYWGRRGTFGEHFLIACL
ncbi:MAG: hypothetical protein ACPGDB_02635, partial [Fusobacterium sp.]